MVNINGEPVELCATKVKPEHGWLVEGTTIDARNKAAADEAPTSPRFPSPTLEGSMTPLRRSRKSPSFRSSTEVYQKAVKTRQGHPAVRPPWCGQDPPG